MIFYIGKTKLKLSFSFVALIVLMIILCDERIVLCSLFSSLIHECGHLFFMCITSDIPKSIELSLFGMRIEKSYDAGVSYKKELLISLGGIIFNVFFAAVGIILYNTFSLPYFMIFSAVNVIIASVNSFPVTVLDCGRAVRCLMLIHNETDKAEKYLNLISATFIILFIAMSLCYFIFYGFNISLFAINFYLILITIIKKWS